MTVYVLDTNVLLSEGKQALYSFGESDVVIPKVVLQELDSKKTSAELGYVARSVLKEIRNIFKQDPYSLGLSSAVIGEGYGSLQIFSVDNFEVKDSEDVIIPPNNDGEIIKTAQAVILDLEDSNLLEDHDVVIVTKDVQMSIYAHMNGFEVQDLVVENKSELTRHVKHLETFYVSQEDMDSLYSTGFVDLDPEQINVPMNIGVILKTFDESSSALAISKKGYSFELVVDESVGRIYGKNAEQKIASNILNDDSISVVSLTGPAGSGKSLMALAMAIDDVENGDKDRVIVYRPINPVGGSQQELGFLPGDLQEKMQPHKRAVFDTLEAAVGSTEAKQILRKDYLTIEPVSFVRGRTISNATIILEECQNLEFATILSLLTRAGSNTKVYLVWDMSQRDNQYIQKNDGAYRVVKSLIGDRIFGHVPFSKSERSAISDMAVRLLDEL